MNPFDADQRLIDRRFNEITAGLQDAPGRASILWIPAMGLASWAVIALIVWAAVALAAVIA